MQKYTKIEATGLPAIYPTGYVDTMFTYNEARQAGIYEEVFMSRKFKIIDDASWKERVVQATLLDKYKLEIYGHRGRNIPLLKHAETVNITMKDETIHRAKILEIAEEGETDLIRYEITYADINPANYRNGVFPVNNPLLGSDLLNYYAQVQLNWLFLSDSVDAEWSSTTGGLYWFYTKVEPLLIIDGYDQTAEQYNGLDIALNHQVKRAVRAYFYLNETEKNLLEKYGRVCETVQFYSPSTGTYDSLEPIELTVKEIDGAVDIYECEVTLKYQNLNFYPYNT